MVVAPGTKKAPARRSTEEVKRLVVEAAGTLFAEHGFAQTTLRAVASSAGISLSVLHRHFPSKEHLFSATLVAPFIRSFEQFGTAWNDRSGGAWDEQRVGSFIHDLYDNLAQHRRTIVALLAAAENPDTALVEDVRAALGEAWGGLQAVGAHDPGTGTTLTPAEVRDSNMLLIALITGLAVFRPFVVAARDDDDMGLVNLAGRFATYGLRLGPQR
jgi:AcrR family transcriptional regulator